MRKITLGLLASGLALAMASPAMAQSKGEFTVGAGVHNVDPKSNNGDLAVGRAKIDNSVRPTVTFEYFVADNLGVEVLAAWPFEHDIEVKGLGRVGTTKQLPPVVSLQYHFANSSRFTPFLGMGLNYTKFFSTKSEGAIAGADLDLKGSWGFAAHAGIDFAVNDTQSVRLDARWIKISTDVRVDRADIGKAKIDPLVYGMAYVWKF